MTVTAGAGRELWIAEAWIYQVLAADPVLEAIVPGSTAEETIWPGIAPTGTPEPYIILAFQGGTDVNALGSGLSRIFSSFLYQVAAYGPYSTLGRLAPIAQRIDELLHGKSGEILDDDPGATVLGTVLSCVRERPLTLPEVAGGKQYRRLGGVYRLQVQ